MKKRILGITMIAVLALAMTACGKKTDEPAANTTEAITTGTETGSDTATISDTAENMTETTSDEIGVDEKNDSIDFKPDERKQEDSSESKSETQYVREDLGVKFGINYNDIKTGFEIEPSMESYTNDDGNITCVAVMNGSATEESNDGARDIYNIIELHVWSSQESYDSILGADFIKTDAFVDDANRTWNVSKLPDNYMVYYSYLSPDGKIFSIMLKDFRFDYDITKIINSKTIVTE